MNVSTWLFVKASWSWDSGTHLARLLSYQQVLHSYTLLHSSLHHNSGQNTQLC